MRITTLSGKDFNQYASEAKKAAKHGPVFITDRGRPAHVLLSIEDYQRMMGNVQKIADLLAMPDIDDIEFNPSKVEIFAKPADLS